MDVGMLWFDNDSQADLPAKIRRAAAYYRRKYGDAPDLCYVNPAMVNGDKLETGALAVKTSPAILPNHFWLGVNGEEEAELPLD